MKRLILSLLPLTCFAAAPATNWAPNVTGLATWQTNVSNGVAGSDRIDALSFTGDLLSSSRYTLTHNDAMHVTAHLGGDYFPRFSSIDRVVGGARVDWQHTFGDNDFAPVFTLEAAGDGIYTGETARRGTTGAVTLTVSKRFGSSWRAAISEKFDRYDAKRAVFGASASETAVEIGRDINESTRFTVTGRWRDGDVVSYAENAAPELAAVAHDTANLNTFRHRMDVYALNAQTVSGRVALVQATAEDRAIILAYEYARTSRADLHFVNQSISLALVRQF